MNIRRHLFWIALIVLSLLALSGETLSSSRLKGDDRAIATRQLTPMSVLGAQRARQVSHFESRIQQVARMPSYVRLSDADYMINELLNDDVVEMDFYEWEPGTRDLRHVAVRAAWFVEELLGIELQMIDNQPTAAERTRAHEVARLQYDAYRRGVLDMVDAYRIGENRDMLVRGYQHLLAKDAYEESAWRFRHGASETFEAMLEAWFPIGKSFDDLEFIVGRRAARVIDSLDVAPPDTNVYVYGFGAGGPWKEYYFFVADNVITHVFRNSQ